MKYGVHLGGGAALRTKAAVQQIGQLAEELGYAAHRPLLVRALYLEPHFSGKSQHLISQREAGGYGPPAQICLKVTGFAHLR